MSDGDMFLDSLIPKDLKGFLRLGNLVVPGLSNIEKDIVAIWGLVEPLLKDVPKALEKLIPAVGEVAVAVLNEKDPSDEQIVKLYKAQDKAFLKQVLEILISPEVEALLNKAIAYDFKQVKVGFVKPHVPLIKSVLEELKKMMTALRDAAEDGKYQNEN